MINKDQPIATLTDSTVYLKTDEGLTSFCISEILYFQTENDEVHVLQVNGQIEKVHHTLKELEDTFSAAQFFRCHAKNLINLSHIKCYNHKIRCITLSNENKLNVAKKRKQELKNILYSRIPISKK